MSYKLFASFERYSFEAIVRTATTLYVSFGHQAVHTVNSIIATVGTNSFLSIDGSTF